MKKLLCVAGALLLGIAAVLLAIANHQEPVPFLEGVRLYMTPAEVAQVLGDAETAEQVEAALTGRQQLHETRRNARTGGKLQFVYEVIRGRIRLCEVRETTVYASAEDAQAAAGDALRLLRTAWQHRPGFSEARDVPDGQAFWLYIPRWATGSEARVFADGNILRLLCMADSVGR